jgi:hypothetical protein
MAEKTVAKCIVSNCENEKAPGRGNFLYCEDHSPAKAAAAEEAKKKAAAEEAKKEKAKEAKNKAAKEAKKKAAAKNDAPAPEKAAEKAKCIVSNCENEKAPGRGHRYCPTHSPTIQKATAKAAKAN